MASDAFIPFISDSLNEVGAPGPHFSRQERRGSRSVSAGFVPLVPSKVTAASPALGFLFTIPLLLGRAEDSQVSVLDAPAEADA